MDFNSQKALRETLNLFLAIVLITGGIISGLVSAFYRSEINSMLNDLKNLEKLTVTLQKEIIEDTLKTITGNLLFLANQNELIDFLNSSNPQYLGAIEREYVQMSQHVKTYDQIRYLDKFGHERVRVNFNEGKASSVPEKELQDKSDRGYFLKSLAINRNEIFVSALDLNIEN